MTDWQSVEHNRLPQLGSGPGSFWRITRAERNEKNCFAFLWKLLKWAKGRTNSPICKTLSILHGSNGLWEYGLILQDQANSLLRLCKHFPEAELNSQAMVCSVSVWRRKDITFQCIWVLIDLSANIPLQGGGICNLAAVMFESQIPNPYLSAEWCLILTPHLKPWKKKQNIFRGTLKKSLKEMNWIGVVWQILDFWAKNWDFGQKKDQFLKKFWVFFWDKMHFWPKKILFSQRKNSRFSVIPARTRSVVNLGHFLWPGRSHQVSLKTVQN